jgi:hypothetical protein
MNTNTHSNKIIVFKTDSVNALRAATEINAVSWTCVLIYESVVTVSINIKAENAEWDRKIDDIIKEAKSILDKYSIEYKVKQMKF